MQTFAGRAPGKLHRLVRKVPFAYRLDLAREEISRHQKRGSTVHGKLDQCLMGAGEAANDTKALSMGQLTDELAEGGPQDGIGQVSKWGFVPGDDNTTDLDLERQGEAPLHDMQLPQHSLP